MSNWDRNTPVDGGPPVAEEHTEKWEALDNGGLWGNNLLADPIFEMWSGGDAAAPDHWAISSGTPARQTASMWGGMACRLTSNGISAAQASQHVLPASAFLTRFRGREFSFACALQGSAVGVVRPFIDDGITVSYGTPNVGTSDFEWLGLTRTLDVAATKIRVGMEVLASGSPWGQIANGVCVLGAIMPRMFQHGRVVQRPVGITVQGTLVVGAAQLGWRFRNHLPFIVVEILPNVGTASGTSAILLDANKDGSSMYSGGGRPTIAAGSTVGNGAVPDGTYANRCFGRGHRLTFDIDQVGAGGNEGVDLTATALIRYYDRPFQPLLAPSDVN